jgi:hypothetical protein
VRAARARRSTARPDRRHRAGVHYRAQGIDSRSVGARIAPMWARMPRRRRIAIVTLGVVLALAYAVAFLLDEPLRRIVERRMNEQLAGYRVRIGTLDLHPFGLGLDLENVTVVQEAAPEPPLALVPALALSVHWRDLLHGALVADCVIERPIVRLNLKQAESEARDDVPVTERGWQDAVQAAYPLEINEFRIEGGDLTYDDGGQFEPVRLHPLDFEAANIRNVRSAAGQYPSAIHLRAVLLDTSTLQLDGHADFLAKPHAAVKTDFDLRDLRLDYLQPALHHFNLELRRGTMSAEGEVEYTAAGNRVEVRDLTITNADVDYLYVAETAAPEREVAQKVASTATRPAQQTQSVVKAAQASVRRSTVGFVDTSTEPTYRLFLDLEELAVRHWSNQMREGTAEVRLRGAFMGSGRTEVDATFRPDQKGPDFDLAVRIEDTELKAMNDLLRAYGGFDVDAGTLAFFSELHVQNGLVRGYVKPLFKDIDVYNARQDAEKPVFRKMYEGLVGGIANLFENRSAEQIATETQVSGRIGGDVKTSTLQIVVGIVRNAFFQAILPGLERELRARRTG